MIVKSRRIYMEDGLNDGFLVVEDGTIKEFLPRTDNEEIIDYGDMRIIPGIFDTHNHGTCGFGLSGEVTQEEIKGCAGASDDRRGGGGFWGR